MKILYVIQRFPPAVGGGEEVVFQLSRTLVKMGHQVTVATSNWLKDTDIPGISASRLNLRFPRYPLPSEEMKEGIRILRFRPYLRFWTYTFNPELATFLFNHLQEYDIVHAHSFMFAESDIAALASRLKHKPFVLTHHGSFAAVDSMGAAYSVARFVHERTIGRLTLNYLSRIIVLDEAMRREFEQTAVSQEKVRFIPNGINLQRFRPKMRSDDLLAKLGDVQRIILFVGRLEKAKGPHHLVESAPQILDKFPNTRFVFVGEDWGYERELVEMAERLKVKKYIFFAGRISEEELIDYYNIADALVVPSPSGGFVQVALEGIACGTPTIVIDSNDLLDVLDTSGIYGVDMKQNMPNQIADAIEDIFSKPNLKEETRKQRRILEQKLSWDSIAKRTETVYLEAIGG